MTQLGFDALAGEEAWARPLVRVTPARLGTWEDCPRRYRLTYLDKAPGRGARAASTLGSVVHLALRALFARPRAERTPAEAAALVDRNWIGEGFRDTAQQQEYRLKARTWVEDYVAEHGAPDPLAVERWVSVSTGGIVAEGRVDRIDPGPVIVDYKTGRHVPTTADAGASPALALYALATTATLRQETRRVELHHLPSGTVAAYDHSAESLAEHRDRAEAGALAAADAAAELVAGGSADALFPARPAPRCAVCDMRRNCPEGQAVGPAAQPWEHLVT
ncbi:RecB family exonuclease [Pseudonocardia oroxyli]|uniref:RecB family exonuclease n=1 Tax=Pseudonocardia oroxyli TaxID=366584 RepID=A0A1G7QNQ7_PSEOR|nr:PD-(D/E)XK nuclease family protein [Pseudonocardia oroxyli]SDG00113.1 RecB family exonuclease [Pseudonocardia oroxyli]